MNRLAETSDGFFIEKQAGIPTHVLLENLRKEHPSEYLAPVYYLDDEVSGPLLISKHPQITEFLRNAYGSNQFLFTFYCWGKAHTTCLEDWICDLSIAWDVSKNRSYPSKDGKKSSTHFTILKRYGNFLLLECRTNYLRRQQLQIHAHFSCFDILGDTLWCTEPHYIYLEDFKSFVKNPTKKPISSGLHLHLTRVEFPLNGISVKFSSPCPKTWERIEKFLQKYTKS